MQIGIIRPTTEHRGVIGRDCVVRGGMCIPRGDRRELIFNLYDEDGDEYDTALITDARFIVSEGQLFGGNIMAGGEIYFERTLSNGIYKRPNGFSLGITLMGSLTSLVTKYRNYYQLQVSIGTSRYTVAAGLYQSEFTQ